MQRYLEIKQNKKTFCKIKRTKRSKRGCHIRQNNAEKELITQKTTARDNINPNFTARNEKKKKQEC